MNPPSRPARIAARFEVAATRYDAHVTVQPHAAATLAARILDLPLPPNPRILEIGCGTGLLTRALAERLGLARWTLTDISPAMLAQARAKCALPDATRFLVMDGEYPDLPPEERYDLICSSLAVQWFDNLPAGLERLARYLAPGGHLAISTLAADTFKEWRAVHAEFAVSAATPDYPVADAIAASLPRLRGRFDREPLRLAHRDGLEFLRSLKGIGATVPRAASRPMDAATLKRVLTRFNQTGATVTYDVTYASWQRAPSAHGVFVTGTDTGVGKTLVSALLAYAWNADYWKPLQTGIADEAGDTPTVTELAQLPPSRVHAPLSILQAPLSPWAAAALEDTTIDVDAITLPVTRSRLVVEGAGGLFVPVDDRTMMIDVIARLGLPVVLVARSGLGTINHTLLSLQALRAAGIPVCGVVMNGPPSAGNRHAIERFGNVRVIAEIPQLDTIDTATLARLAPTLPDYADVMAGLD